MQDEDPGGWPGALVRWRLRDALFPRSEYALMWQRLIERLPERRAAQTMIALLELAAGDGCEVQLAHELAVLLERDELPDLERLTARLKPRPSQLPEVFNKLQQLHIDVRHRVSNRIAATLSYLYEPFDVFDFAFDQSVVNSIVQPGALVMGYIYRPYTAHSVMFGIRYFW